MRGQSSTLPSRLKVKTLLKHPVPPAAVLLVLLTAIGSFHFMAARPRPVADRLTDQEFWKIVTDSSEPGGYFRAADITNLTSNETLNQYVLTDLVSRTKPGGVYLGVGPEQNYTYIAALKPRMAIIFDIRRGNLDIQLMYKAIFELSKDRADFISMLFSRPRPSGLTSSASANQLFRAFANTPASTEAVYVRNLAAITDRLTKVHGFSLLQRDAAGIATIYRTFYESGYAIRPYPSYDELMTATDQRRVERSYLATEENYAVLRDLESKNLVIPVVGDFGGPTAIRAIGKYLKENNATVTAFYLSNVEEYLYQQGKWNAFCRSVSTLPLDSSSTFIRSDSGYAGGFALSLSPMMTDIKACAAK
jgi:hypothetical protein